MKKIMASIVAFTLIIGIFGCAKLPMESRLDKPVSMTRMTDTEGKSFVAYKQAFWLFWGLAPLIMPEIDDVIGREVSGHVGVQNLKITTEYTFIDIVINALTSGVLHSRTITIEGQVYD